jgi:hypothetical protein
MAIEKSSKESSLNKPDSLKQILPDEISKAVNKFNTNKFVEKSNLSSTFNRNDIVLHANIPAKNHGAIRNMFIDKYIQTQGSSVFLEDDPAIEIKI